MKKAKKSIIFKNSQKLIKRLKINESFFLHIFQLRSFQIIILQTFLIAIIINNNIRKYLLTCTRQKRKKKLRILVKGHHFKISLIVYNTVFSEHYINSERGENSKFT
jgi:hypothetical protein